LRCVGLDGDLDAVGELYTLDQLRQLVVASEPMPVFLRGVGQLEDHGERGLVREAAFRSDGPMPHGREGAFDRVGRSQVLPVLGGEVVEGEQECVQMPRKMARSAPSTTVRAAQGAGSRLRLASVLQEGRKSANIHARSEVIRGILA
jgi:hypothetical protein